MEDCAVCPIAQAADFIRSLRKTLSAFFHPIPPISQNQYFVTIVVSYTDVLLHKIENIVAYLIESCKAIAVENTAKKGHKYKFFCDLTFVRLNFG